MRVLVVDDDKFVRDMLRMLLEGDGIECHEAEDGIEALAAAREIHPDVVILDVMLPGMDGYKISRMLKFDENFSDIAVIMLTSRSKPADGETGYNAGADLYMTKPFDPDGLLKAVRELAASTCRSTDLP